MQRKHQSRRWIFSRYPRVPTWIRQLYLSCYRDLLFLQKKGIFAHRQTFGLTQCGIIPRNHENSTNAQRPPNPIEFLAAYLLKNKSQFEDRN
ncbi:protein dpy-30 homolog isoform X3 [Calonectris borealis]|uniref:protein dpy-30 homolog isoform X3 n=1 Tax=Calonectris borealis TaxID=1323832 RepID=UPI003F4C29F8